MSCLINPISSLITCPNEFQWARCPICLIRIPSLRVIIQKYIINIETQCQCNNNTVIYQSLPDYITIINSTRLNIELNANANDSEISDDNTGLLSYEDFIFFSHKFMDNEFYLKEKIIELIKPIKHVSYELDTKTIQKAYDTNHATNESLISLIIILYQNYKQNLQQMTFRNLKAVTSSLSKITNISEMINENSINKSIVKIIEHFQRNYIIRIASLPLSFKEAGIMIGHRLSSYCLYELSNGFLLSGSDDHTLKIWNITTNQTVTTLIGHTSHVYGIQELSDGGIVSTSADHTIIIWNSFPYKYKCTLEGNNDNINSVIQLKDGRLATGSDDCTIKLWDLSDYTCIAILSSCPFILSYVGQLYNGRLYGVHINGIISIWDMSSYQLITTLTQGESDLWYSIQLNDGRLVGAYGDEMIRVWCVNSFQCLFTMKSQQCQFFSLCELEDGIIFCASPSLLKVFDLNKRQCLTSYTTQLFNATFTIRLNDGRVIYSSNDNNIHLLS